MHLSIILLEWKTLPIDRQITAFLQRSETVCTSFEILCLRKVGQRFCAETRGKYLPYHSSTWNLSLRRQDSSTFRRGITEKKKKGAEAEGGRVFSIRMRKRQRRTRADHPLNDKIYLSIIRYRDGKLHHVARRMVSSGLNGENWESMHYLLTNGPLPANMYITGSSKVVHPSWLSTY
jgi:hypothetical protein